MTTSGRRACEGAIASLKAHEDSRIVAGGHSLLPMMKLRLAQPSRLIDINDLTELQYIREEGDEIAIGALTRHVELLESELLTEQFPVFRDAELVIADPVVRNRGTIGGSLCQADAAEDLSAVCAALKGVVTISGADGSRTVPMSEFHLGPWTTAVQDGEILTEIRFKVRPGAGSAHEKVERRAGDWAIAAASAALWIEGGKIADAGIALSSVGLTTIDVTRGRGVAARRDAVRRAVRAGRRDRERGLHADPRRPRTGRLQAPPRGRPHQTRTPESGGTGSDMNISISINGETVTRDVEPRTLLVHFIRDTEGLTGTHWGCDTSNCGACVVLMDGKPLKSCTALAAMCEGHEIRTVESLEVDGELDPIQQGFHECHALQCGFCTPGMLMTTRALLDENPDPTEDEIRMAISGAICRCTGYKNIVAATRWAAEHQEVPR